MNSFDRISGGGVVKEIGLQPSEELSVDARPPQRRRGIYRNAYIYFSLALLVAIIGFFPSYFAKLRETDAVHHFHGIMASVWMIGLITQSWLMRQGMTSAHRMVGKISLLIAPLFVISGILVVHVMLTNNDESSQAFGGRLAFIDMITMCYFSAAYSLAIHYRRKTQFHARYMASTAILVLPPALVRLLGTFVPGLDSFEAALHASYFICEAIVATLLLDDYRKGSVLAPYIFLLSILVLQHLSFMVSPSWLWWSAVISWIRGF
jgi:hypothetical protein